MTTAADLMSLCRAHLDDDDMARLVGWIAWRLGRNQALAGGGSAAGRLEHVVTHWLDDPRRRRLDAWLRRRLAAGMPPVPR